MSTAAVLIHPQPGETVPLSVNYFPHRVCNYACGFCFHTTKNSEMLPLPDAKRGLKLLADAGMERINISGGEPFLQARFLGEIIKYCKVELRVESTGIICNGSKVTEKWLDEYGSYLDIMGVSCDSFDDDTNLRIGRSENGRGIHKTKVFQVADWCRDRGIKFKLNTVVNRYNVDEDMSHGIEAIAPSRWKVWFHFLPPFFYYTDTLFLDRSSKFCYWKARIQAQKPCATQKTWLSRQKNFKPSWPDIQL